MNDLIYLVHIGYNCFIGIGMIFFGAMFWAGVVMWKKEKREK